MAEATQHSFPGSYGLQLLSLLKRWNIPDEDLLEGTGLTPGSLAAPDTRMTPEVLGLLYERTRSLTGEDGIGFYLGMQKRPSMYGFLGFAAMNASTVRECVELLVRFTPTVTTGVTLSLELDGDAATLVADEHVDIGSARDIAVVSLLVGLRQLTAEMTGLDATTRRRRVVPECPFPRPQYFDRFAHLLPDTRFDREKTRIQFEASLLDHPLVAPDASAMRLASEACERQLEALGFEHRLAERVRALAVVPQGVRSIDEVARALSLSTRTLKRRLAVEGTTFSEIVERERHARAMDLLRRRQLSLEEIARRLNYSNLANFARAFRRWTGQTPGQYRRSAQGL